MFRKRFIALVMALTMLFTLMAPAFTFAVGEGDPDPDQTTHSETGEQLPGDGAGEGGEGDADKGGDQGNGGANVGDGDQGNGGANVGDGETLPPATVPGDGDGEGDGEGDADKGGDQLPGDGEGEPLRDGTTRGTITIKVGVVSYLYRDGNTSNWRIHYWDANNSAGDASLTLTDDIVKYQVSGEYWDHQQLYYVYTATIPDDAAGYEVQNNNAQYGGYTNDLSNRGVYVFDYNGAHAQFVSSIPAPGTITVYFANHPAWNTVMVHYWYTDDRGDFGGTVMPGEAMTCVQGNKFTATIPATVGALLFDNGNEGSGNQTVDIREGIVNGAYWCTKGTNDSGKYLVEPATINVIFDLNGGNIGDNTNNVEVTIQEGDCVSAPNPAPTKAGWRFVGWTLPNNDELFNFEQGLYADATFYAQYKQLHSVTVSQSENGTVSSDKNQAVEGETVALTVTPEEGFALKSMTVTDGNDGVVPVVNNSFTMPASDVTVTATFSPIVAKIGDTGYETLQAAVAAANTGDVVEILAADTYTLPNLPKNITLEGKVDGVVFNHTTKGNIASIPNGATIKNVTFNLGNVDYHGFQHNGGLTFEGCVFNGKFFTYGNETYRNCTFNQTNSDYNMWVYGGNTTVVYDGCTFTNTSKGKFLNVYRENGEPVDLTINNCTFINQGSPSKAAVNVKETCGSIPLNFNVKITDSTTQGAFPESSTSNTLVVGGSLWQVDDRQSGAEPQVAVFLDGVQVYPVYVASVFDGTETKNYTSLQAALDAAHGKTGNVTVTLLADIEGYSIVHQKAGLNLTIDGANHTLEGQIIIDGDGRASGAETLTIKNIAFEDDRSHFCSGTDAFVLVPSTKDQNNTSAPYYTGKYNYAHNITVTNCTFTSTSSAWDVVGYKATSGAGDYNVVLNSITATNMHSLAQMTGTTGATITNCTVTNSDSGVNVSGGGGNFIFSGNTFSVDTNEGYGIRLKDSTTAVATLTDNNITAANAIVLSKKSSETGNKGKFVVNSGFYAGEVTKITTSADATITISGGYFTVPPKYDFCGTVDGVHLYAIENTNEATKTDYPYTVGTGAVAMVNEVGYFSFANAAAARKGDYTLAIKLLENITTEEYTLTAGEPNEILKVQHDGKTLTVNAPEGYALKDDTVGGVTTYTIAAIYTVTFNANGGSEVEAQQVEDGKTATKPTDPTKEHYTFQGWFSDEELTTAFVFATPITANVTLYAKWLGDPCTITFINGYTGAVLNTVNTNYGESMPTYVPNPLPTREGYDLDVNNLWTPVPGETVTGSIVYSLNWIEQHTVTFDANGGTLMDENNQEVTSITKKVSHNGTVEAPTPTREGHTFLGWFDGNNEFDFTKPVHDSFTLQAHWQINKYTVTFMDGDVVLQSTTDDYGTPITVPTDLTKDGYIFMGWDIDVPATIPAGDLTINAVWALGVAKIGDTLYASLAEAVAAATDGDTIIMVEDSTETAASTVEKSITIDLNGKTVTREGSVMTVKADLIVKDSSEDGSGLISGTGSNGRGMQVIDGTTTLKSGTVSGKQMAVIQQDSTFVLDGGNISGQYGLYAISGSAVIESGVINATNVGVYARSDTSVTINGGEIYSDGNCVYTIENSETVINNGTLHSVGSTFAIVGYGGLAKLTVNDGELLSDNGCVITSNFHRPDQEVVINGGTLKNLNHNNSAIYMPSIGKVTINGGYIEGDQAIDMRHGYLTITGGTLVGSESNAVMIYSTCYGRNDPWNNADKEYGVQTPVVSITGGNFSGANGADAVKVTQGSQTVGGVEYVGGIVEDFITGGFFTTAPDIAYCGVVNGVQLYPMASGNAEYPYTVGDAVAMVKNIGYPSVADAKDARENNNDVITLLKHADYAFVEGDVLKIYKANDQIEFEYTVEDGFALTISEPDANGVVTYTVVGAVAKIEKDGATTYYPTLQAALTAAANDPDKTGNIKVTLLTDTAETVTVIQRKDQNLVITGDSEAKPTIAGTIKIDGINGGSGHNGTDTLTISNLKIAYNGATTSNGALIYFMNKSDCGGKLGSQHNVTIENCELDGGQDGIANAIYAVRIGANTQAKNVTLSGLTVRNTYCLVNETGVVNFTVQGCNATAVKNGININGGEGNAVIENNVIEAVGYAYRSGSTASGSTVLRGNTFTGNGTDNDEGAVVVRNVSGTNISPVTIESGFYAGEIKAIDTNKLLTITGGFFTVAPALEYCGTDDQGRQLYPIANTDPETKDAYPFTVGDAVAMVKNIGYPSVADAKDARDTIEDVITLLKNADYAFVEGDVLKIYKVNDQIVFTYTVQDGYVVTLSEPDANGVVTYTVVTPVAKIGDVKYATLADAFAAAQDGDTIEMINDAVVASSIEHKGEKVTLDLAGKNVTSDVDEPIQIASDAELIIINTVEGGSLTTTNSTVFNNEGTLTINAGTFKGNGIIVYNEGTMTMNGGKIEDGAESDVVGIWNHGGSFTMNGGEIAISGKDAAAVATTHGGSTTMNDGKIVVSGNQACGVQVGYGESAADPVTNVTINGGNITAESVDVTAAIMAYSGKGIVTLKEGAVINGAEDGYALYVYGTASIAATGGWVTGTLYQEDNATGKLEVTGGYYSKDPSAYVDLSKYVVVTETIDGKVWYTIGDPVAVRIFTENGVEKIIGYASLEAAFAAANDGDTVKLLKDVTIDSITVDKTVTLDLDGHEVKSDAAQLFLVTGDLTITGDGKITGPADGQRFDGKVLISVDGGKLTIENGTLTATGAGSDGMYGVYVLNGGTAIFGKEGVEGGPTITAHFAAIGMNHMTKPATITVYGGTYTANAAPTNDEWWSYFCAPIYAAAAGDITIKGGTFNGYYGLSDRYADVEQVVRIKGGTFNASSTTQVFADEVNGSNDTPDRTIWAATNTLTVPKDYKWVGNDTNGYVLTLKDYVAENITTGEKYETLKEAVATAQDGDEIVMLKNEAASTSIIVNSEKNITIDLKGYTVSGGYVDLYSGFLTIKDTAEEKGAFNYLVYANVGDDTSKAAGEYNSFTLAEGAVMNSNVYVYQNNTDKGYGTKIAIDGTMNGYIFVLGNIHEGNTTIDVRGTINSNEDVAIALNGYAIVNVYDGAHIEAKDNNGNGTGIEVRAGELNVMGGTIKANGNFIENANNSGTTTTGVAVAISQHTTNLPIKVTISGGTLTGVKALYEVDLQDETTENVTLSITEGYFTGKVESENLKAFITQGHFSEEPEASYIIPNKCAVLEGEWWIIDDAVAAIGDIGYASLAKAVAASKDDDTIKMLKDDTIARYIKVNTDVTLDLNGKTVAALAGGLDVYGEFTITDNSDGAAGKLVPGTWGVWANDGAKVTVEKGTIEAHTFAIIAQGSSEVVVNGGTITADNYGIHASGNAAVTLNDGSVSGKWGIAVIDSANLTVNDGNVTSGVDGIAISTNGNAGQNATVVINGGTIMNEHDLGIYMPSGNLTVNDGTITGTTAVYVKSGKTKITGGTLHGTGEKADYSYYGNGANATGDALVVDNCGYPNGDPAVEITGGTFESDNAKGVGAYYDKTNKNELALVTSTDKTITVLENQMWIETDTAGVYKLVEAVFVTFVTEEGVAAPSAQRIEKGTKATKPMDPMKDNYIFLGWFEEGVNEAFDFANTTVTEDITLTAKFEGKPIRIIYANYFTGDIIEEFNVHYDDPMSMYTISQAAIDSIPAREGYHFNLNDMWTIPVAEKATKDIVYVLKWIKGLTVQFVYDNGTDPLSVDVDQYSTVDKPEDPTKEGYDFIGWFNGNNEYEFSTPITASIILTAHWTPKKMTVTFNTNGGSVINAVQVDYDTAVDEPIAPTKENYVFAGWTLDGEQYNFAAAVKSDITLVAQWTEAVAKIGDVYYATLAEAFEAAQTGDTIVLLKDVTIDSITVDKTVTLDLDGHEVKSNAPDLFVVKGDLTITGNGKITGPENGAAFDSRVLISVDGGKLTVENGTLTATGAGSDGMYGVYVLNGGTAIFGKEGVEGGPTITAHFAAIGMNHMTKPATITVYGGTYTANATPTNNERWSYFCAPIYAAAAGDITIKGGTFNGYYGLSDRYADVEQVVRIEGGTFNASSTTQVFADEVNGSNDTPDRTIWAATNTLTVPEGYIWVEYEGGYKLVLGVNVTFQTGDDEVTKQIEKGTKVEKPDDPTREGYTFNMWTLNGAEYDFDQLVTENITLVATWRKNVTVTADNAGKTYGDPEPDEFTVTIEGLNEGDTVLYTVARAEGEDVGEYVITVSGDTVQGDYAVTFVSGKFTITAKTQYTIMYIDDDGTILQISPAEAGAATPAFTGEIPERVGYGYREDDMWTTEVEPTVTASRIYILKRVKIHTVTFMVDEEQYGDSLQVFDGDTIPVANKPADPTAEGTVFAGWFDDNNAFIFGTTQVISDLTLTAKWINPRITYSLVLEDSIDIRLYVRDLMPGTDPDDYSVTYSFNGSETTKALYDMDSNMFTIARCAARRMTDKVHVVVKYNDTVIKEEDYSVQSYCLYVINNPDFQNDVSKKPLIDLCKATLDYGRYAQERFNYKTDDLANGGTDYAPINNPISGTVVTGGQTTSSGSCEGIRIGGWALSLESRTELYIYFNHDSGTALDNYEFKVNGQSIQASEPNGTQYLIVIAGIAAKELDQDLIITATKKGEATGITLTTSPVSYMSIYAEDPEEGTLFKAAYNYHLAAKAYFE